MASAHSKFAFAFYLVASLAAGIALSAALLVGVASESADLILRGASIYTVDPSAPRAIAVAVKGGRFVAVGSDAEIQKYAGAKTRILDLKRQFVVSGFIDFHTHTSTKEGAMFPKWRCVMRERFRR